MANEAGASSQACSSRLGHRSDDKRPDLFARVVQHLRNHPIGEVAVWEGSNHPFRLPADLCNFYLLADGCKLSWRVRASAGISGSKAANSPSSLPLGCVEVVPLKGLKRVRLEPMVMDDDDDGESQTRPKESGSCRPSPASTAALHREGWGVFDLNPNAADGRVVLMMAPHAHTAQVWFQDMSCDWHFLAASFTDYFRLALLHLGIARWEYAFTSVGLDPYTQRWLSFFTHERYLLDMSEQPGGMALESVEEVCVVSDVLQKPRYVRVKVQSSGSLHTPDGGCLALPEYQLYRLRDAHGLQALCLQRSRHLRKHVASASTTADVRVGGEQGALDDDCELLLLLFGQQISHSRDDLRLAAALIDDISALSTPSVAPKWRLPEKSSFASSGGLAAPEGGVEDAPQAEIAESDGMPGRWLSRQSTEATIKDTVQRGSLDWAGPDDEDLQRWASILLQHCILTRLDGVYAVKRTLRQGDLFDTLLVEHSGTGRLFGAKRYQKALLKEFDAEESPQRIEWLPYEIATWRALQHPRILRLVAVYETADHITVIHEHGASSDVFRYIDQLPTYSEADCRRLVRGLIEAIAFLHEKRIAHRNIKPTALTPCESGEGVCLKLGQFDVAACLDECSWYSRMQCGTPGYVAPEMLQGRPYDEKVDVFSAGVVLYALLVGSLPFNEHPTPLGRSEISRAPREDVRQVLLRNLRCEWDLQSDAAWQHVSEEGKDLVTRMMAESPEDRPLAAECLQDPWFTSVDGDRLQRERAGPVHLWKVKEAAAAATSESSASPLPTEDTHKEPLPSALSANLDSIECIKVPRILVSKDLPAAISSPATPAPPLLSVPYSTSSLSSGRPSPSAPASTHRHGSQRRRPRFAATLHVPDRRPSFRSPPSGSSGRKSVSSRHASDSENDTVASRLRRFVGTPKGPRRGMRRLLQSSEIGSPGSPRRSPSIPSSLRRRVRPEFFVSMAKHVTNPDHGPSTTVPVAQPAAEPQIELASQPQAADGEVGSQQPRCPMSPCILPRSRHVPCDPQMRRSYSADDVATMARSRSSSSDSIVEREPSSERFLQWIEGRGSAPTEPAAPSKSEPHICQRPQDAATRQQQVGVRHNRKRLSAASQRELSKTVARLRSKMQLEYGEDWWAGGQMPTPDAADEKANDGRGASGEGLATKAVESGKAAARSGGLEVSYWFLCLAVVVLAALLVWWMGTAQSAAV
ncbi:unnamed protein product [Vitrella brassicaformis CCMP3155]|uniref:Protein kinase domain-containing protein n=1 Tax=Vitrella brassicaformis (strain CCMP3155) TaxID=1169540 RepID=A0A0G4GLM4_VITBC|nr:unnamed protein product [Vitrella brassicaformis CCMP3155]|eukprot:CEM31016.1 unnamed protein product [Vitrella brassicaformis CCMP3155]